MPNSQDLMTTQEFAEKAGLTPSTVSKWLRSGKLKGEKIGGKWMIPADQGIKKGTSASNRPQASKSIAVEPKASEKPHQDKSQAHVYTVEEFASMTYLTPFGVQLWLKTGRLTGQRDASGHWAVDASNLESTAVQRLLRK